MNFDFTPDQTLLVEALAKWSAANRAIDIGDRSKSYLDGSEAAQELREQGYFEVARTPDLGVMGAVLLIEGVGATPYAIEVGVSGLVAPALDLPDAPYPLAVLRQGASPSARFLAPDGAALVDCGDHLRLLACGDRVEPLKTPYAYPAGRYLGDFVAEAVVLEGVSVDRFRFLRSIAAAAEALAAIEAALALTVEHVKTRIQFKRPIGSFQAVQHRLAECSAAAAALRWLLYRAAVEHQGHDREVSIVAHDAAKRVIYETTQFHGALGLTIEYPLHLWTYRLRVLQIELAQAAAETPR
jgi:hypothetical protein